MDTSIWKPPHPDSSTQYFIQCIAKNQSSKVFLEKKYWKSILGSMEPQLAKSWCTTSFIIIHTRVNRKWTETDTLSLRTSTSGRRLQKVWKNAWKAEKIRYERAREWVLKNLKIFYPYADLKVTLVYDNWFLISGTTFSGTRTCK